MFKIMRKWFERNPYVPAILRDVEVKPVAPALELMTKRSSARIEKHAQETRTLTESVLNLHDDLIKLIGKRA